MNSEETILALEKLKEFITYNSDTGIFTWIKSPNKRIVIGSEAGYVNKGYVMITLNKKLHLGHRVAWFFYCGKVPSLIDHIDRNKGNNKINNLREATLSQNQVNSFRKKSLSGFRGVVKISGKNNPVYVARHFKTTDGRIKNITIGRFDSPEKAYEEYVKYIKINYGEFAPLEYQ